ncbi:MAG: VTT domain-containing protein [Synergistaceae bacterium]|jgi:uncharacterized membrane protein YdjX (TVP38/TMEM64 family)|nr:VTT domain-containing protein [Synergistaceae bacterium]
MKGYFRPFCLLSIVVLIFFLNRHYGWSRIVAEEKGLMFLQEMVKENLVGASLAYVAATVMCCVVLALPGVTFALFAGLLFGPVFGTLLCLFAATLGAALAFLVGRYFLRDAVKPMIEKNRHLRRLLFDDIGKSGMALLMITRLLPFFPYNLQNFAYGITGIGFWPYTVYTFIFLFPGVAFFTIGAAGIADRENRWICFLAAGLLALAATIFGLYLHKRYIETLKLHDTKTEKSEQIR